MSTDYDHIAAVEKAIAEKYGSEAIENPRSKWDEKKKKNTCNKCKNYILNKRKNEESKEKIEINGIKVSKKLLNREQLRSCPVCGRFPRKSLDDVCLIKYDCCSKCYIQYVDGREQRWKEGWRPNEDK